MLLCGIEDPLVANEQLYATAASGGRGLASFSNLAAARCTFISVDRDEEEVRAALHQGRKLANATVHVADAWTVTSPQEAFRERAARTRYEKEGAALSEVSEAGWKVAVATSPAPEIPWPLSATAPIARRVAFVHTAQWTLSGLPTCDAHEWARNGLAPSEAFVQALVERAMAACYAIKDDLGRHAAVVVGERALVSNFSKSTSLIHRYEGARAGAVLRVGPAGVAP